MNKLSEPGGGRPYKRGRPRVPTFLMSAAAFVVVVAGMKAASPILVQILLAVFIAVITTPLFFSLCRLGIRPALAFLILIIGLVVISVVGVSVIGSSVAQFSRNVPFYQEQLQGSVGELLAWLKQKGLDTPDEFTAQFLNMRNIMLVVTNSLGAISGLLGKAFIILLIAIFILFEAAILPSKVRAMPGLTETNYKRLEEAVANVRQYMGMKTLMCLLTGVLVSALLAIMRLDYAILLGVLAFLLNYVPNIGSFIAAVPGVLLALIQYGPGRAGGVAVAYVAINVLVGNILEPRLMGRSLGLSPVIIVISLIFWGWVLGPIGMLLSVPLTMTVKIGLEGLDETRGIAVLMGGPVASKGRSEEG